MTPQDKKELAEWGHGWLKLDDSQYVLDHYQKYVSWPIDKTPFFMFESWFAPILAHLTKRKMEEMGFHWIVYNSNELREYVAGVGRSNDSSDFHSHKHENEYQCLWLAIRSAINGNKD